MKKFLIAVLAGLTAYSVPAVAQDLSASEMAEMHAQRLAADQAYAKSLTFREISAMETYSPYEGLDPIDPWREITNASSTSVDFDRDGKVDQVGLYRNSQQYAAIVRFADSERRPLLIYKAAGTGENVDLVSSDKAVLVSQSDMPGPILYMKGDKAVGIDRGL